MPDLPRATIQLDQEAGAHASGAGLLTVIAAVARNADALPRIFSSAAALLEQHLYSQGADYSAMHFEETNKPVMFIGLPIATAGSIGRIDTSGNTGTSVVSVAAGGDGVLEEVDGIVTVSRGGTVATDQIMLGLSLDGGKSAAKTIRIGTATSYVIPYFGLTLTIGAGDLNDGDTVLKFSTKAPMWDADGIAAARTALAAQQKQSRNWLGIGDIDEVTLGSSVVTQINAYATAVDRCSLARVQVRDRKVQALMSRVLKRMTGTPTITFAEVGVSGDTITRSAGSFVADGFAIGDVITVAGSVSNNVTGPIASLTATVITLGATDLAAEGPISNVTIVGSNGLTFAEVGGTGDTITRTGGSWLADGFAAGDLITVASTASNNFAAKLVTAVTATVLTLDTQDLVAETIGSHAITITAGETDADWVADIEDDFEDIATQPRIDMAAGRTFKESPITHWFLRRGAAWVVSLREYQHDVHISTYRKSDGVLSGCSLEKNGVKVEHDERIDGGLLLAGFTCLRTYSNGPEGVFVALSLTRGEDGSLLSRTHNMHVANIACNVAQAETENAIGQLLELNDDGTGTESSLSTIDDRVNSALAIALLQNKGEGKRATDAKWKASRGENLEPVDAVLNGTLDLRLGRTIEKINTRVRVR
jgi:hypothetical protein